MTDPDDPATRAARRQPIKEGEWHWWPQVVLRAPGFPADGLARLAAEDLAAYADELAAHGADQQRWSAFETWFTDTAVTLAVRLQEIAGSDTFRTAVAWQNHHLVDRMLTPLVRWKPDTDPRDSRHRKRENLVASYWQRYCAKNDTIGFFGPVGWATLSDVPTTSFSSGEQLVDHREVFFEPWAIDRLAESIQREPGILPWLPPRRLPFIRLDGDTVTAPIGPPVRLGPLDLVVLRMCDGTVRPRDMPAHALRLGYDARLGTDEVMTALAGMRRRRWIAWQLDVPVTPWPEHALRAVLDRIGDAGIRQSALDRVDLLERARDAVRSAAGDPERLIAALRALDDTFEELTGQRPVRNEGRAYGGRTLVYLDCRRAARMVVGRDIVEAAAPIELLARGARWFCWRLGERARATLHAVYRQMRDERDGRIDLASLWFAALAPLRRGLEQAVAQIRSEFRAKWATIFDLPVGQRQVSYTYGNLAPLVEAAFDAPAAGWHGARYLSPDVMVLATDVERLDPATFRLVLGEVHMAINTQRGFCFRTQAADGHDALRYVDEDFPEPMLLPVLPKGSPPRLSIRTHPGLARARDFYVEFGHHTVPAGRPRLLLGSGVDVIQVGARLALRVPTGEVFDLLDPFSEILMDAAVDQFRLFDEHPHTPRVTVDRLVVTRETWCVPAADLTFARTKREPHRFVGARAWRADLGLPRHVFVTAPGEKPIYVDFASPVYVNLLAKTARVSARAPEPTMLRITEMLPSVDALWLTDRDGNRYTAELRLTAFDSRRPPADAGSPT